MTDFLTTPMTHDAVHRAVMLFALVTARLVPIIQLVPYLGGKATPQIVKLGLAVALSLLVYPTLLLGGATSSMPAGPLEFSVLLAKEALVGLTLGFVAALVFESVRMAGQIIDNARGQTMATALVPQLPERASVSADLLYQLAVVLFLLLGGHRLFIAALVYSYQSLPPHAYPAPDADFVSLSLAIATLTADAIAVAVALAFPVVAAILLADLFLAFVNKAAPQINVFFLGMPLKALLGTAVLLLGLDLVIDLFLDQSLSGIRDLHSLIGHLTGAKT